MDLTEFRREQFGRVFLLLLALGISIVFFGMIKRMAVALLLAAIFAGMSTQCIGSSWTGSAAGVRWQRSPRSSY